MAQGKQYRLPVLTTLLVMLFSGELAYLQAKDAYHAWESDKLAIQLPLQGLQGNPSRGKQIVSRQDKGNCLTCHSLPIPNESFQGTIGPPLHGIAARRSEGEIRLHVVDQQKVNPETIMPGFYKNPQELNLVLDEYLGKTLLSAQEVEDVVAYLMTLE